MLTVFADRAPFVLYIMNAWRILKVAGKEREEKSIAFDIAVANQKKEDADKKKELYQALSAEKENLQANEKRLVARGRTLSADDNKPPPI